VFAYWEDLETGRIWLDVEPQNLASTPEELLEKALDSKRLVAGGLLDSERMEFTILEIGEGDAIDLVARSFGARHGFGVQLRQFIRSEVMIKGKPNGRLWRIVESSGLDFSPN
jgi:hypothetical protein